MSYDDRIIIFQEFLMGNRGELCSPTHVSIIPD